MAQLDVVICTYDRYEVLPHAIEALVSSRGFRQNDCQLYVVENTPVEKRLDIAAPDLPTVTVGYCNTTGLSFARNHGIQNTTSDLIAFLDDDAIVSDDWASEIVSAFKDNSEIMAVGGRVTPEFSGLKVPGWYDNALSTHLSCIDWGEVPRTLRPGEWIVGANMAFRRQVFTDFGLFDTSLGRKGSSSLLSNEEIALLQTIGLSKVLYVPSAGVRHVIPKSRMNPDWFRRRVYWQAISDMVSGIATKTEELRREYGLIFSEFDAADRNINALLSEPVSYAHFEMQLRGIYHLAVILGGAETSPRPVHE